MFILDASLKLILKNPAYRKAIDLYVWQAYLNDLGRGDLTTDCFVFRKYRQVVAKVVSKDTGILAGMQEAEWFLKKLGIQIMNNKKDGAKLKKGDVIIEIRGWADKILAAERTLLNLLQRMSGVATATKLLSQKLPRSIRLLATRKTLWGDLDKRAVSVGGGMTHRLNLNDAILIKENHIALNDDPEKGFSLVDSKKGIRFAEIELQNMNQVVGFAALYQLIKPIKNLVVMLDNFKPIDIKKALLILKKIDVLVEISGGINEKNIKKYAIKGVDAISSGAITNKADALDFSLQIK